MSCNETSRPLRYGDGAWNELQEVIRLGHAPERVFSDWLDLMLTANLSLTDNYGRKGVSAHPDTFDGIFEARYRTLAVRYRQQGAHEYLVRAYDQVCEATAVRSADVLGELYTACMKQAGRSFLTAVQRASPRTVLLKNRGANERIVDPACGSGARLIEAGKRDPSAELHGIDADPDCVMMCALNMLFFNFRAVIQHRGAFGGTRRLAWSTSAGFIAELNVNRRRAPARYRIALHDSTRSTYRLMCS